MTNYINWPIQQSETMVMFRSICKTPVVQNISEANECFASPLSGRFLITASRASHPLEEAFQSGAAGRKALLMVHLRTQQEAGGNFLFRLGLRHGSFVVHAILNSICCTVFFQPFCDGAHKSKAQGLSPLRFIADKDATVWLCGCKHTHNPPYCDGTHKQAVVVSAALHQPSQP